MYLALSTSLQKVERRTILLITSRFYYVQMWMLIHQTQAINHDSKTSMDVSYHAHKINMQELIFIRQGNDLYSIMNILRGVFPFHSRQIV